MKQNYAKIISGFILAGLLTFSSCQSTHEMAKTDYQIAKVEGRMIDIDAKWDTHPDADAVAILKPYKEKINELIEKGVVFLCTGNALEIFGKYIENEDGSKIDALRNI